MQEYRNEPRRRDGIGAGKETQVVGFRLPRAFARELKAEAGRRGLKLNELFAELWKDYKSKNTDPKP